MIRADLPKAKHGLGEALNAWKFRFYGKGDV